MEMSIDHFAFSVGQWVELVESGEKGRVIARAEYESSEDAYLIRYKSADGRLIEAWWGASAIVAQ